MLALQTTKGRVLTRLTPTCAAAWGRCARLSEATRGAAGQPAEGRPHLVYPQQEWSRTSEHLLVEVSHRDEHLVLLVDVYLVQGISWGHTEWARRSVKANTALHVWIPNSLTRS